MKITKYSDIDLKIDGKYLLDTGEYFQVRVLSNSDIRYFYCSDSTFSIYHRSKNLPAIIFSNGDKELGYLYLFNDIRHNAKGPAVYMGMYRDIPYVEWHLNGIEFSEEEFNSIIEEFNRLGIDIEEYYQNLNLMK